MFKPQKDDNSLISKVWQNLDTSLAILGLIASAILALWLWLIVGYYIEMAVFLFLACATYLLIAKRRSTVSITSRISSLGKPSTYLILSASFFVIFSFSIISLAVRPDLYSRPLEYFIATALMAAVVVAQIFVLPSKKSYTYFLLFQIMLLGLSLRFIPQLLFPGVIGIDPWFHQAFTTDILETGHITGGFGYAKLPIMHLIIGSTSLVTGLDYANSTMLSLSLIQVIIFSLFAFLLGSFVGRPKVGLLSGLLLIIAPDVLATGFGVCPNGFSLIWILIITYVLFKVKERRSITSLCLSFLFMGVLILSHTVAALAMAILLFCFWIGFEIYKKAQRERFVTPVSFYLSILFTVGMLSWWMYASGHITFLAELIELGFNIEDWGYSIIATGYIEQIAYSEYLLDWLGFLLFYAFAIIGSLSILSPASRHRHSFVIVLGGSVLVAIAFFSQSIGFTGVLSGRWFYLSQLLLVIPAARGLMSVSSFFSNRSISRVVLFIVILVMSFFMITNSRTNYDNPIYTENITVRLAFTASELRGMNTISNIWGGKVSVVTPDDFYFRYNREMPIEDLGPCLLSKDFSDCRDTLVIIREEIVEHPLHSGIGQLKLDYDPRETLEEQGFSCIYNDGSVTAYLSR